MSTPILCPVCGKDDAIQKVSAIVASGRASGTLSGPSGGAAYVGGKWGITSGYTTLSGGITTELARKLSPPPQPRAVSLGAVILLIVLGGSCLFWGLSLLSDIPEMAGWFILAGVLLIPIAIAAYQSGRARVAEQGPAWEKSMQKWSRLYYCFRDDLVFDPSTGKTCQPESLAEFLKSESGD